jgi:enterochelin esterase-like enzyme
MEELGLAGLLEGLYASQAIRPLLCVAIHAGTDRKMEYGTAGIPDFKDRGAKAADYTRFIFKELLPFVRLEFGYPVFREKAFAGFSLGGLSALDIVWSYPYEFTKVGIFSGSLWWRKKGLHEGYEESKDRIMHELIREGNYAPWLRFFFETGTLDETMDRNNNGVIDSIDDTLALIEELVDKGYDPESDIYYLELKDGKHDIPTWGRAMPVFLQWAFPAGS